MFGAAVPQLTHHGHVFIFSHWAVRIIKDGPPEEPSLIAGFEKEISPTNNEPTTETPRISVSTAYLKRNPNFEPMSNPKVDVQITALQKRKAFPESNVLDYGLVFIELPRKAFPCEIYSKRVEKKSKDKGNKEGAMEKENKSQIAAEKKNYKALYQ